MQRKTLSGRLPASHRLTRVDGRTEPERAPSAEAIIAAACAAAVDDLY